MMAARPSIGVFCHKSLAVLRERASMAGAPLLLCVLFCAQPPMGVIVPHNSWEEEMRLGNRPRPDRADGLSMFSWDTECHVRVWWGRVVEADGGAGGLYLLSPAPTHTRCSWQAACATSRPLVMSEWHNFGRCIAGIREVEPGTGTTHDQINTSCAETDKLFI